jgi:hypothetical protein
MILAYKVTLTHTNRPIVTYYLDKTDIPDMSRMKQPCPDTRAVAKVEITETKIDENSQSFRYALMNSRTRDLRTSSRA